MCTFGQFFEIHPLENKLIAPRFPLDLEQVLVREHFHVIEGFFHVHVVPGTLEAVPKVDIVQMLHCQLILWN